MRWSPRKAVEKASRQRYKQYPRALAGVYRDRPLHYSLITPASCISFLTPPPRDRSRIAQARVEREHEVLLARDRRAHRVPSLRPSCYLEGPHRVLLRMKAEQAARRQEVPEESRPRRRLRGCRGDIQESLRRTNLAVGLLLLCSENGAVRILRRLSILECAALVLAAQYPIFVL